jgi:hypothetical protein
MIKQISLRDSSACSVGLSFSFHVDNHNNICAVLVAYFAAFAVLKIASYICDQRQRNRRRGLKSGSLFQSLVVTICTTRFNIHIFCVLLTQCIYVFCVDLRTNSDYFTIQI